MTQNTKSITGTVAVNLLTILATALITGAITWGANNQRLEYMEREIQDIRPMMSRIDKTLSAMEQMTRDNERRISRLER
jgi:hypothetical protein